MSVRYFKAIACGALCAALITGAAQAAVLDEQIVNRDTYIESIAPRGSANEALGQGYYLERQYNFGLERLVERQYGEQAMQVIVTPFADLRKADGTDYITDVIKPAACKLAKERRDTEPAAKLFATKFCPSMPKDEAAVQTAPPAAIKKEAPKAETAAPVAE